MTNEQINITIAKVCGFYQEEPWSNGSECWGHKDCPPHVGFEEIPDYCNDLNAMHEAEKILNDESHADYACELVKTIRQNGEWFESVSATAAKRAEAFLRTINKWEGVGDE
jgi:hypothetical protein